MTQSIGLVGGITEIFPRIFPPYYSSETPFEMQKIANPNIKKFSVHAIYTHAKALNSTLNYSIDKS